MPETQQRPTARIGVEPDSVHKELTTYGHWVVWSYVWRDEDWTKVPFNPNPDDPGKPWASTRDSRTWKSFDEAVVAYIRDGYDGIGFVLSSGDPYTGLDFDKVRNAETGELEAWVQGLIDTLGGYVEISPSGEGVHIFVRGDLPSWKALKSPNLEMYSAARFFTITGVRL